MAQRGRRSLANLATPRVDGRPPRLEPPADLTDDERTMFCEIVGANDSRALVKSDVPLLISFVQMSLLARTSARANNVTVFEKAVRMQAALATKLRLTPSARITPRTAGRMAAAQRRPRPWEDPTAI